MHLRYALRSLRRTPILTAAAIVTLALGIGVSTAIFSVADRLLMRPLTFPDPDRLVSLWYRSDVSAAVYENLSYPDYLYYRDRNDVLTGLAAYAEVDATSQRDDRIETLPGEIVSANYFRVLGVQAALGRAFLPEEDQAPDASPVVILSDGLWRRWFGADPGAVGREVVLNHRSFTIVGVMPRGFSGLRLDRDAAPAFWTPFMMYPTIATFAGGRDLRVARGNFSFNAVGRLKPGTSLADANEVFARLTAELRQGPWRDLWGHADEWWKDNPRHWTAALVPAAESRLPPKSRAMLERSLDLLGVISALVLFAACLNVANLLLARGSTRAREMAVRLAIGAGRAQVLRQLGTEGLVLSLLGGAAGLAVAILTSSLLASFHPPSLPLLIETRLDARMVGFALLLSLSTGVLFGLVPARAAFARDLVSGLRATAGGGPRGLTARTIVVVAQAALSVFLLVGAGLFVRTLHNARAADITVAPGRILVTEIDPAAAKLDEARGRSFYANLLDRVESLPGVRRAALVMVVPMGGRRGGTNVSIGAPARTLQVDFNVISPSYFETVGIPVVRGRPFNEFDRGGAPGVAIVNERWAERFWPGQEPLGQRFDVEGPRRTLEVVGVVRDGKFRNYRASLDACFYVPLAQQYQGAMSLEVGTAGEPQALVTAVQREMQAIDPAVPLAEMRTLEAYREAGLGQERMLAGLLSALGALALVLTAVGIFGMLAFVVSQRTREIGIRMALGARAGTVLALVLKQGLTMVLAGVGIGLAAAALATRAIASLLYDVAPTDPWTFAAAACVLVVPAIGASYLPARRAARVDPIEALRAE